ncbi:hypothetical protein KAU33_10670 [Candidatus Dependentiae bacterium]|nr:hypothetical protein [Candidatus Dependentiae bacterium]
MIKQFLVLFFALSSIVFSFAGDYDFDVSEFEKKPFEINTELKINPILIGLNTDSIFYQLQKKSGDSDFYSRWRFELYSSFKKGDNTLFFSGQSIIDIHEPETEETNKVYEYYLESRVSANWSFIIGKKSVKWGKGYVFNPVSFAGRQKDVNDVDASLEGYGLTSVQYIKSLKGPLSNYSVQIIALPGFTGNESEWDNMNSDFPTDAGWNFIGKLYLLYRDVDIDFYILYNELQQNKYGFDMALNLTTNFEVHGEVSYEENFERYKLFNESEGAGNEIQFEKFQVKKYLAGVRYLTVPGTTFILEYIYNEEGLSLDETKQYFEWVRNDTWPIMYDSSYIFPMEFYKEYFTHQFSMQNYLYLKASHPEPFDILYFTPGIFSIYNLDDNSFQATLDLSYSRFDDFLVSLKYSRMFGDENTEFGEKIITEKLEFNFTLTF